MPYVIKTNKGYVKRTSYFGHFHGSIILTQDKADAFRFTRKSDASIRGNITKMRTQLGDGTRHWRTGRGMDHEKFGELSFILEEV